MKKSIIFLATLSLLTLGMVSCNKNDDKTDNSSNTDNPSGEWVDLGLPSGLLWAKCNLGASTPEGNGNYYAWAETRTKDIYNWTSYSYCTADADGSLSSLTKYNTQSGHGTVDNKTSLESADDAATAILGTGARIPTKDEWNELIENTEVEWTTLNNVNGRKFTSRTNGNSIFLPAAGNMQGAESGSVGVYGNYWTSSLNTDILGGAWYCQFRSSFCYLDYRDRCYGLSVRAVWNGR